MSKWQLLTPPRLLFFTKQRPSQLSGTGRSTKGHYFLPDAFSTLWIMDVACGLVASCMIRILIGPTFFCNKSHSKGLGPPKQLYERDSAIEPLGSVEAQDVHAQIGGRCRSPGSNWARRNPYISFKFDAARQYGLNLPIGHCQNAHLRCLATDLEAETRPPDYRRQPPISCDCQSGKLFQRSDSVCVDGCRWC